MSGITPEQINPLGLPSLPLEWRKALPECPGIYFALGDKGTIQYIGRSNNIRQRWLQHHRYAQLEALGGVRIAWLQVSDDSLLPSIETALINYFQPPLNNEIFTFKSLPTDKIRVSAYIDLKLKEEAEKVAAHQGRSLSNYIEHLIKQDAARAIKEREI